METAHVNLPDDDTRFRVELQFVQLLSDPHYIIGNTHTHTHMYTQIHFYSFYLSLLNFFFCGPTQSL